MGFLKLETVASVWEFIRRRKWSSILCTKGYFIHRHQHSVIVTIFQGETINYMTLKLLAEGRAKYL